MFLDRDGVVIENRSAYVRSWADVSIYDQAVEALRLAAPHFKLVVVTNQSAVGRGIISIETAQEINRRLADVLRERGVHLDGVYMCPHAPELRCACRKPQPGLLLQAARELSLDLAHSVMVGDALSDLAAGRAAGVARGLLVLTGRGLEQAAEPAAGLAPGDIFPDLHSAVLSLLHA